MVSSLQFLGRFRRRRQIPPTFRRSRNTVVKPARRGRANEGQGCSKGSRDPDPASSPIFTERMKLVLLILAIMFPGTTFDLSLSRVGVEESRS